MCKYHHIQNMDKCMKPLIDYLNVTNVKTLACCCGHWKYNMSIVVKNPWDGKPFELLSRTDIPRKSRFYVKDKEGYYYIPELINKIPIRRNTSKRIRR